MSIDPVVVGIVVLAVAACAGVWALMAAVLWGLDRIQGWLHRRNARRRPWR